MCMCVGACVRIRVYQGWNWCWAVSEESRRYGIVIKYLGIPKYPVLSLH